MKPASRPSSPRRSLSLGRSGPRRARVVVGVGESPSSTAALEWARGLCRRRGWVLDVVTAWPDQGEVPVHEVPGHYCDARGRAVGGLLTALSACAIGPDESDVHVHVENADPVRALVEHSRGAELLVVGEAMSGRSRRAGCAPIEEACRQLAECSVVVVSGPEAVPRSEM